MEKYAIGEPIPVKTELRNTSKVRLEWIDNPNAKGHCDISLFNENGEALSEEMIGTGAATSDLSIDPGKVHVRDESTLQGWPHEIHRIPAGRYTIVGKAPGWVQNPIYKMGTVLFRLPITVTDKPYTEPSKSSSNP